jgi:hypothetical protein
MIPGRTGPEWASVALDEPVERWFPGCFLPRPAASIVILANDETANLENLLKQLLPAALEP